MNNLQQFGVSFSVKQCWNFKIDPTECLDWLMYEAGFRRFRLMSYWNEIEKHAGEYDFAELDRQIAAISKVGGTISMCLGVKQPRWPEYHWPNWTKDLEISQKNTALLQFVEIVVTRYKNEEFIVSWQLENEALLSNFGNNIQIDRSRILAEYNLIKELDPKRPIIMSTSNGWGLPVRQPIPDIVGFSYYANMYQKGKYRKSVHRPWLYKLRKYLVDQMLSRPTFIHELQLEPWGHTAIWKMNSNEQAVSMSESQITKNLADAKKINAYPIDLWGAEWWYWRRTQGDDSIWDAVKGSLKN